MAVMRVGKRGVVYRLLVGNLRERNHWGDPGVEGRVIWRWIFRKWSVGVRAGSIRLRIGTGGGHL